MTGERTELLAELGAAAERLRVLAARADEGDVELWQRRAAEMGESFATLRAASAAVSSSYGLTSGQARLLAYFRAHVGETLAGVCLAGIAGIDEWARRVRELRVEHGWPIESALNNGALPEGCYVLVHDAQDHELVRKWQLTKRIRNERTLKSGKARALELLKELSPEPADQEMLSYVAKIKSWQRRLREADEEGWQIRSNIDEPQLAPGTYRLASLDLRPPRARQAIKLRYEVLERDNYTCQDCDATRGSGKPLQVHHKQPVAAGGTNDPSNLITLCSSCHAGRHALASADQAVDELENPGDEPTHAVR